MKHLSALIVLLLLCVSSQTITAQATDSWATVSLRRTVHDPTAEESCCEPDEEEFREF